MRIQPGELRAELEQILLKHGFETERARLCALIFANNSRDGVHSHGVHRFPTFIDYIKQGLININAEPAVLNTLGCLEQWDGQLAPGVYVASKATDRAVALARMHGMGCVAVRNTNHWMRGGTYGWQAADQGCIAILGTNSIANMPPHNATTPALGNNPLVIAVPRQEGHVVLDMAMSQFSYGKLNEYKMRSQKLPVPGGFDTNGNITTDPGDIIVSQRTLPIGYWKGSGLSLMMDLLVSVLSEGRTVGEITSQGSETGVSQFFICIRPENIDARIVDSVIAFAKSAQPEKDQSIKYPGEQTLEHRRRSESEGIEINDSVWQKVKSLA
jgi:3-dehydro-L-gulonate 2-dehydrogenase